MKSFCLKEKEYQTLLKDFEDNPKYYLYNLHDEFIKFIDYWTELNKSGSKQRWELQKTFEVKKRIVTWLGNAKIKTTVVL